MAIKFSTISISSSSAMVFNVFVKEYRTSQTIWIISWFHRIFQNQTVNIV
jgi:hypothetical protein